MGFLSEILKNVFLWLYILITVPIVGFLALLTKRKALATLWCRGLVFILGIKIRVVEGGLPPKGKKYVFMCNHQSQLDIPVLEALLKDYDIRFLAKRSLFKIPFFGWGISVLGYIPVEREDPKEGLKSLYACVERIKEGHSLVIFPEGTRSKDGSLLPFKKAGFLIPIKAGVEVCPVVIWGTFKILPKGSLWFRLRDREVKIIVGPLFSTDFLSLRDKNILADKVRAYMEESLNKLKTH
ncbi:MAG: lysophospholipid acyltransferase family protein [Caldimicrobium sp.]